MTFPRDPSGIGLARRAVAIMTRALPGRGLLADVRCLLTGRLPGPDQLAHHNPADLHRLRDDTTKALLDHYHQELADLLYEVCAERGLPAPVLAEFTATDNQAPDWSPNEVLVTFADATERHMDFGTPLTEDAIARDSVATQLLRAYLAEVCELDPTHPDYRLMLAVGPTVKADIVR